MKKSKKQTFHEITVEKSNMYGVAIINETLDGRMKIVTRSDITYLCVVA